MSSLAIWSMIALIGIGTYLLRWSFLGALGNRPLPEWAIRMLRYTAVAVLPALVAPLVVWPEANAGQPEPARLAAALATLAVGFVTRSVLAAILAGGAVLGGMLALIG